MTHHHLGLKITYGIKSNTNHNKYRSTAERNIYRTDVSDNNREYCNNTQENSSHEGYS